MKAIPLYPNFTVTEVGILKSVAVSAAEFGDCLGTLSVDKSSDCIMASMMNAEGGTWLCVVKTRREVHVYKNEAPRPYWTGPSVEAWAAEASGHQMAVEKMRANDEHL